MLVQVYHQSRRDNVTSLTTGTMNPRSHARPRCIEPHDAVKSVVTCRSAAHHSSTFHSPVSQNTWEDDCYFNVWYIRGAMHQSRSWFCSMAQRPMAFYATKAAYQGKNASHCLVMTTNETEAVPSSRSECENQKRTRLAKCSANKTTNLPRGNKQRGQDMLKQKASKMQNDGGYVQATPWKLHRSIMSGRSKEIKHA